MTEQTVAFDYAETGTGTALLFLPGSFGTGAGWKAVMGHLGDGYRMVTTSLLGYGATPDIRPDGNATMAQQVDLIDRIIDRIGTSPHVVGHSYGGLSAIVHALSGRHRPASLLLVEANPIGLLRASGDLEHYGMFESMTAPYFADFARGDAEAARRVIDFYGGAGTFDSMPPKVRSYIISTTAANVRDWSSGTLFEPSRETLQSIDVPTTVKQPPCHAQDCRTPARCDSFGAALYDRRRESFSSQQPSSGDRRAGAAAGRPSASKLRWFVYARGRKAASPIRALQLPARLSRLEPGTKIPLEV